MRISPLILLIALCILPLRALAEVNCSVFDAIERIQFAQMRLSVAGDTVFASRDVPLIHSEVSRLDGDQINSAHDGKLSALDVTTLSFYIADAQLLSNFLKTRNLKLVQSYFERPSFAQKQEVVARILPRLQCNPHTATGTSNGTQRVTTSIKQNTPARKITFAGSAATLAAVVIFIALSQRAYILLTNWKNRRNRRSKRFHCHIETQITYGAISRRAVILDMSCNGVKIQVDLETHEPVVEIWIINAWHKGKVSWHNPHYLGVRFDTPLRSAFVQAICSPAK